MRRIVLPLMLALVGLLGAGSLALALPSAHAQAPTPSLAASPNPVQIGNTAAVAGQSFAPNNWAYLTYQRPDGTTGNVFVPTSGTGTLSFNLGFTAAHGSGNEFLRAYDYGTGRWTLTLTVVVVSNIPTPIRHLTASSLAPAVGSTITLTGLGFTPNHWVYVYFQRPDRTAGAFWAPTGATGGFSSLLGFTAGHGCGAETIWAYNYATGQWSAPVTVTVTGCSGLAPPSDLRVVSATVGTTSAQQAVVTLQWRDNSANETGFRIRTTLNRLYGGSDSQAQDAPANATTAQVSFVAGGINPVKTACFTVSAFNASGESKPSNQVCVQLIQQ